jgi:SAM-dependent methyltransferase
MKPGLHTIFRPCPICEASNKDTPPGRFSRDGWTVIECADCKFVYLPFVPATVELESELAWEKTFDIEAKRRRKKQPAVQWLDRKTRWRLHLFHRTEGVDLLNQKAASGPAIDLGCGAGGELLKFEPRFTPYGVEISKGLAEQASRAVASRDGSVLQASSADGLDSFADDFFTAALLRSYLEHDWEARDIIRKLYAKMAPGGAVAVKVPNFGSLNRRVMGANWCGFRLPDHVNYFDKRHLRKLAEDAGFRVDMPFRHSLPTDDNMLVLLWK